MAAVFPDIDTLHLAVSAGWTPTAQPVVGATRSDGRLAVAWEPGPDIAGSLRQLGVEFDEVELVDARRFDSWLQLFPLIRDPAHRRDDPNKSILFELPASRLATLAGELLRLGYDRWDVMCVGDRTYVRGAGPPYFSLLSAIDRRAADDPRAFREVAPRVWVECGVTQPLADRIVPAAGRLVLIRADATWSDLPDGPFHDAAATVRVAPARTALVIEREPELLEVPIALAVDTPDVPATLWIAPQEAVDQIDRFVGQLDRAGLDRLVFGVGDRELAIRLRPGCELPDGIVPPGRAYRAYRKIGNLFIEQGQRVDPPLQRETLRRLLANDPARVVWIGRDGAASLDDAAFRPLAQWIDLVIERDRPVFDEWVRASEFAFAEWVLEEVTAPTTSPVKKPRSDKPVAAPTPKPEPPATAPRNRLTRRPEPIAPTRRSSAANTDAIQAELTRVEQDFLAIEGPLDHPGRVALWPRIARLNSELDNRAEAAAAWTSAVWESPRPADEQLWGWVRSERALPSTEFTVAHLDRLLAVESPAVSDIRALAATVTWAGWQDPVPAALRSRLEPIQAYLLRFERSLPVRPLWLAWSAWSRAAGGDTLALVRARDRLLGRLLDSGLSPEADLPGFLRYAGRHDSEGLRDVRGWLDSMHQKVRSWAAGQLKSNLKSDPNLAYVDLNFAFGLARLGEAAKARELIRAATAIIEEVGDDTHAAHLVILQGLTWRIEQSLQGMPHTGSLPKEWLEYLAQMHAEAEKMPRTHEYNKRRTGPYAIERLREQSRILEPMEKFDPYRHMRRESRELVRQAVQLADERDPSRLPARINALLKPTEGVPELRIKMLGACVPLLGRLPAEFAGTILEKVPAALTAVAKTNDTQTLETRLRLIERSVLFAGHFDRGELVPLLVEHMVRAVEADSTTAALDASGEAIGQTLRGLRKLGLRDEAIRMLDRLESTLLRGDTIARLTQVRPRNWPSIVSTLLPIAAGWLHFEQADRAEPIFVAARDLIRHRAASPAERVPPPQYAQIVVGLIAASGFLPPKVAQGKIAGLFEGDQIERLPNTFTTAPFYSRFHLAIAEAVVMTLSGDEFALGPAARRWLDEEEYLIRRRVHADVRQAMAGGA